MGTAIEMLLLALLPIAFVQAQTISGTTASGQATPASRPKVCLVLSGGGARGAAHVGVLKVLEALRVPIDCITGTSMGALIGGAYASGMTTDEMEALVATLSTDLLFKDKPPRQEEDIRRKLDDRSILFGLELGLSDRKFLLPKGLVSGVQLESILRQLSRLQGYHAFDDLPIPYRAVATDLVTGKKVVFSEGELPNVMRASMSVPGVIAPANVQDYILVDGGLTDNLPVDVARLMGADIVIAVNLGTPLLKREELTSVLGVTAQMINILTEQNVQASLASLRPTDILIEPELREFSATNFDELAKTVPIGEAAARRVESRLAALSVPAEAYAALRSAQRVDPEPDTRPIDEIRFSDLSRVNPKALARRLDTKVGEPMDQAVLDRDLRRLFGTGDFEHVNYRILDEPGGHVLDINAIEKSWGPNYVRFGLGLISDLKGDSYFNVAASYRRTWINSFGAEWRTDVQIGNTNLFRTEFYQPVTLDGRFFVAPSAEIQRTSVDLFDGSQRIARYDIRTDGVRVEVGTTVTKYGEARVGLAAGSVHPSLDIGPPELAPTVNHAQQGAATGRFIVDQLDSANFPRDGFAGSANLFASLSSLGADDAYTKWDADGTAVQSFGRHTVSAAVKFGGSLGSNPLPRYDLFQWGGLLQQSGYPPGALVGERLTFGRAVYYYKLLNTRIFEGMYAGGSLELGRMDNPLVPGSPAGWLKSASIFLGIDTPVGPLYLGYGRASDGNSSAYLFLGRP